MVLTNCINYLLTTSQHKVFLEMSSRLDKYDITPVQYGVLNCLWTGLGSRANEVAKILQIEYSTMSGVIDRMEKKGLLTRQQCKDDRRSIELVLTSQGKKLKEPVLAEVEKFDSDVLEFMDAKDKELLKNLLRTISETELV